MNSKNNILEILNALDVFSPVKICFNDKVIYNDYDSREELEPGVFGEQHPWKIVVPERLASVFEKYDIFVTGFELHTVHQHHCIIYLHGEKLSKE